MNDLIHSDLEHDQKNSWRTDPVVFNALDKEFKAAINTLDAKIKNLENSFENLKKKIGESLGPP